MCLLSRNRMSLVTCVCVLCTGLVYTGIVIKSNLSAKSCSRLWSVFWRLKIIIDIATFFLTKLNICYYNHEVSKKQKGIDFYGNVDLYRFYFHNLLLLQCFSLAGSKYLSLAILCNGPGLWNIMLKAPGILQSNKSLQED